MVYRKFIKPLLDYSIASILILVLIPVWFPIIIILFFINRGKVFFIQQRPGYKGKPFHILKFKTMTDETDGEGNLLPDAERITAFGKFIRKTSIDELPQLINILKGDLSLIGPRPLLMEYLHLYTPEQFRRHEVKPGITGWSQINGRNALSWEEKFSYDIYYVDHISFLLDVKILFLTFLPVLAGKGVNQSNDVPMDKFTGSSEAE